MGAQNRALSYLQSRFSIGFTYTVYTLDNQKGNLTKFTNNLSVRLHVTCVVSCH